MIQMNLITEQKQTQTYKLMVGEVKEFGMDRYTLLYLKLITNKDLLYSTGDSAQCHISLEGRGVWGKMDTCVCTAESLYCPP